MKQFWAIQGNNKTGKAEIFIYGYIDPFDVSAGAFVKELRELEKSYGAIDVRINSGGGSVFEGIAIYNALVASKAKINTYVDGLAASMASIIAQAGEKRYISKFGQFMTHRPSLYGGGDSSEHKKNIELLEGIETMMAAIYSNKAGISAAQAKEKFMNGKDEWFDAVKAIENGLADEQYDAAEISAPAANLNEKQLVEHYQVGIAARFTHLQNSNTNMEFKLTASAIDAMKAAGIVIVDQSNVDAIVTDMIAKAKWHDENKPKFDAAINDAATAKTNLEILQKQVNTDKVKAIKEAAVKAKKMTVATAEALAKTFENDPDGFDALVKDMPVIESVVDKITGDGNTELAQLLKMSFGELDKAGKLARLKELSETDFKAKRKEAFPDIKD